MSSPSPSEHTTPKISNLLCDAGKANNQNTVESLIADGCDVNKKNSSNELPLQLAIKQGNLEITKVLLRSGANYDNTNFELSIGPLHIAASGNFIDIVEELIKIGADVNARDFLDQTPLHFTRKKHQRDMHREIMKVLINAGADVNAKTLNDATPLYFSICDRDEEAFEMLLRCGAKIRTQSSDESILLNLAACVHKLYYIQRLIELGANINVNGRDGNTCLHKAVKEENRDMVEFLLNNGADINALNDDDLDPLCGGLKEWFKGFEYFEPDTDERENYLDCINLLMQSGANLNRINKDNLSCLYITLSNYKHSLSSEFLRILLKNGANFDFEHPSVLKVMNKSKRTPLAHLIVRHAALFEAQNRSDGPMNFNVNKLNSNVKRYYASCRDELQWMKDKKIRYTNIPFFKILAEQNIALYTENKHVQNVFKTKFVSKQFPIYHDLISERFTEKFESQKIVRKAITSLSRVLNWNENSMKVILDKIVGYLNKKDLSVLADM